MFKKLYVTVELTSLSIKKKLFCRSPEPETTPIPVLAISITHPSDVLDMPVDPNEPTYCLCHQVSYGEMIGCDNADVSLTLKMMDLGPGQDGTTEKIVNN